MLARNSYLLAYYCLSNNNIYRVYHVRKFTLPQRIEKMDETSLQIVTIRTRHGSTPLKIWRYVGKDRVDREQGRADNPRHALPLPP